MKQQVSPDHYNNPSYDSKSRFINYWHQINEIISLDPQKVLEIGIGNSFVCNYLMTKSFNIKTLDIDKYLKPDVVGTVFNIPIKDNSFDVLYCCEVLEHLNYSYFKQSLMEVGRVSQKYVVLSLPDVTTVFKINIEFPFLRKHQIKKLLQHPFCRPKQHIFDGQHYWEIGKADYPLKRIKLDIGQSGFNIIRTYRAFESHYHRLFLLEKL